ncbi:hypothetical protein A6J71_03850 [Enterobacter cancerogenus]|nr:hypothetical protein A6J71_03850 [Enterobacter cancerogenus]
MDNIDRSFAYAPRFPYASAGRITLSNPDSQQLSGGRFLCTCTSTAAGTFIYITKSRKCAAIKTFDTSQTE